MTSPNTLLPLLIGGAIGIGGILQGLHWRSTGSGKDYLETVESLLRLADEEIEALREENESLRALAGMDREFLVPPELIMRAEEKFGLAFLAEPLVHRLADDELGQVIAAFHASRTGRDGLALREEAARLIGWIGPDDRWPEDLAAADAVAGVWFDESGGGGFLGDRFSVQTVGDQAALMGLVARILLHQHFPPASDHPGDDAARARAALHHGAAALAADRYFRENKDPARQPDDGGDDPSAAAASATRPARPSGFAAGLASFREAAGKSFAARLLAEGSGHLLGALEHPPATTRGILQPDAPQPRPPETAARMSGPSKLDESAGQLGLTLWLEAHGDPQAASGLATAWTDDRYQLLDGGLVWDIRLDDPAAADQMEAAMLAKIADDAGVAAAAAGEWITTPSGRHLQLSRTSPTRLMFFNFAHPETPLHLR